MANSLSISNVINISVSAPGIGLLPYNTANLALFTRDSSSNAINNTLGYGIYLNPTDVATDFGSSSTTYQMANAIFSQQPNILAANGALIIIPFLSSAQTAVQTISFIGGTDVAASGAFELTYGGAGATASIAWNASAATIQSDLRALTGLSSVTVSGSIATQLVVTFAGVSGPATLLTVNTNTLEDINSVTIVPTPITTTIGSSAETLDKAITRTSSLVQYFGCMAAEIEAQNVTLAAASVIQALNKILTLVSDSSSDIANGGTLDLLRSGGFTQTRGLYYGDSSNSGVNALTFMAAYMGLALSVNFNGSNTTQTMHLKSLSGIQPDPTITQTLLNLALAAGADTYPAIQGIPKVFTSGANKFFDQVQNLQWLVGELQVQGFNALAQTATKVPQTEQGVSILKGAYAQVCEQAIANQYIAPGTWTSSTTFGNQQLLLNNIAQKGYYIYSAPIGQQLPSARASRQSPLIQIAIKEAGAIQSSDVIVYVNA